MRARDRDESLEQGDELAPQIEGLTVPPGRSARPREIRPACRGCGRPVEAPGLLCGTCQAIGE